MVTDERHGTRVGAEGRAVELAPLLDAARADLHRYAARLTGSVFDGEDVVQDVIARALAAIGELAPDTPLRPWLFRMVHNRSIDLIRSREVRARLLAETIRDDDEPLSPFEIAARAQATALAIDRFLDLPPAQRGAIILKDVLGQSLQEIAAVLDLSVASVKAHLNRGRSALAAMALSTDGRSADGGTRPTRRETERYVAFFNARDWAGLTALLADDVQLVQTARATIGGRERVAGTFFDGYARTMGWSMRAAQVEGRASGTISCSWIGKGNASARSPTSAMPATSPKPRLLPRRDNLADILVSNPLARRVRNRSLVSTTPQPI
jgi:RNA polymerase sigma-70 factor, ECF subfamily